jgi:hypothetical protein
MTLKEFFDIKMILLFVTMAILIAIMSQVGLPGALDARFFYTNLEANLFLQTRTTDQLQMYRFTALLDLFFIYKYSRALTLALWRLYPRTKIWIVGVVPGIFDLLETGTIIAAIHSPSRVLALPGLGYITAIKWLTAAAVVVFTLWSLLQAVRNNNVKAI